MEDPNTRSKFLRIPYNEQLWLTLSYLRFALFQPIINYIHTLFESIKYFLNTYVIITIPKTVYYLPKIGPNNIY